jgi:formylmethanofuran dehydrogenase subunit E
VAHPVTVDRQVRAPQTTRPMPLFCAECGFPAVIVLREPEGGRVICRHCMQNAPAPVSD